MDSRVRSINRLLQSYDGDLFSRRDGQGMIHVYRRKPVSDYFEWEGIKYVYVRCIEDYILSLSDTWYHDGRPVEWGLEPLLGKLQRMDSWRDDTGYERFARSRETYERDKIRMRRNEWRAAAADARRDFAKATNEIIVQN